MKGFALRLVMKQRHKRTRKWPIGHSPTDQCRGVVNIFSWRATGFHRQPKPFELNCFIRKIDETSVSEPFPNINNTVSTNKHFVKKSKAFRSRWISLCIKFTSTGANLESNPWDTARDKLGRGMSAHGIG